MNDERKIVSIDEWRAVHAKMSNDEILAKLAEAQQARGGVRFVDMTGSDTRMDERDIQWSPINSLPVRCEACGFPEIDAIPQPYFLIKSRTKGTNEMAPAWIGNFLVRERAKRVLEIACPGA